ncbi:MAG: hypothetical protein KGZ54_10040 [Dethiobacter sp.]|jgi:hypothetical protein|nr:hypothetical protein [Dethiobacter sp.]
MFHPYVTFDELRENARFLLSVGQATFWNLSVSLILFRGTKLVDQVAKDNLLGEMIYQWAAYDYKFIDSKIKLLAKAMNFNNNPVMVKLDSAVRYVENMLCKLNEQLDNLKDIIITNWDELDEHKHNIKEQLHHIQEVSVEFFLSAIYIVENDEKIDISTLKDNYLCEIDNQIDLLNSMFVEYINRIETEIA